MSSSDAPSNPDATPAEERVLAGLSAELRERIDRYELLAAATCDAIWDWDVPNQRVFFSPRWKQLRGLSEDDVSDHETEWSSRIHPEDLPRVMAAVRAHLDGETEVFAEEYRVCCKDGSWIWILDRGIAVRDERGQVVRMAGSESDITARKRAEESLIHSEQRLLWALQAADGGVWEWSLRTGDAWWSQEMYALWGLEPRDLMRFQDVLAAIDERDRDAVAAAVDEAIAQGTDYNCEFRVSHPVRGLRWMSSHGRLVRGDDGMPAALLGLTSDVTERKEAAIAHRMSEERLRQLADALPQLVWTATADGVVDYYNSRALEYEGLARGADGTWSWQPVLHPDDREPTVQAWRDAVATGAIYQCEHRVRMIDGSLRWHLSRAVPLRDESGSVSRWFGTATDIHDLKLAEESLKLADQRKDRFIATLAHELRNPLAPIRNALEILKTREPVDELERSARDIIDRQLNNMVRLIDDLLDVSRISRGELRLQRETVTMNEILEQALEASRPHLERAGHDLVVTPTERPLHLDADPMRLAQVFSNLLNNACRYTARGGCIQLIAAHERDQAVVRIVDNGIGIGQEDMPRLFEMFSQGGAPADTAQAGLGVGLAIAKGLVEMHGGKIEARSPGRGLGTEMIVRLPSLPGPDARRPAPSSALAGERPKTAVSVLVVDDNEDIVASLAMLLKLQGCTVETAHDGVEAVAAAQRLAPAVILLDIGMPGLNGYEACEQIRRAPGGSDALIYALTGYGQDSDRQRAREAGFDELMVKPVAPDALLAAIGRAQDHG